MAKRRTFAAALIPLVCAFVLVFSLGLMTACGNDETASGGSETAETVGGAWYYGAAVPSDSLGVVGDYYLNTKTLSSYKKTEAGWMAVNTDGGEWLYGQGVPTDGGNVNDFYLDVDSGDLYHKSESGWGEPVLKLFGKNGRDGVIWFSGEGEPQNGPFAPQDAMKGDFYLDYGKKDGKQNFDVWQYVEKEGVLTWENLGSIRGKDGVTPEDGKDGKDGTRWYYGKEAPEKSSSAAEANVGDMYLRSFDAVEGYSGYQIYAKEAEGWKVVVNNAVCYVKGLAHVFGEDNICKNCGVENVFASEEFHEEQGGDYVIKGAPEGVTELYIPGEVNGKEVKLAKGAFADNKEIESVVIGEGITEFTDAVSGSDGMFQNCTNLTSVTLPSTLKKINNYAFNGCKNLKSIEIPEGVTEIATSAFQSSGLTHVEIPASVTGIGQSAFANISSLQDVVLHDGLETIGNMAFELSELTSIKLPSTLNTIGQSAFKSTAIKEIDIPDSVETIRGQAFYKCMNLTRVKIGKGVTELPGGIFNQCAKLMTVEIGENVTSIEEKAFGACYKLVEVRNLSSSLDIRKGEIDNGYAGAYAIEIHKGASKLATDENGFTFYTDADGKKYLVDYSGTEKALTLPAESEYVIHNYAFYGDKNVTNIVFGDKVTAIGDYAFANMAKFSGDIKGVVLGENITSIGAHAFEKSTKIAKITLGDKVKTVGDEAFSGCTSLTQVFIGSVQSELTSLGSKLFDGCRMLYKITFKGSRDTWKGLAQEKNLFNGITSAVTITCTDGNLDKTGAEM